MSPNQVVDEAPSSEKDERAENEKRSRRWRSPDEPCLNCGDPSYGNYCPSCGQRKVEVQVSVRTMMRDVLEDQLALSGALPRTLFALLFRPGHLTNEYIRGRIVSYIAPFRLYLVASVLFFLIFSFIGLAALENAEMGVAEVEAVAEARAALATFERELAGMDTAAMPAAARSGLRSTYEALQATVARAVEDSTAAAMAMAQMTGTAPGAQDATPTIGGDTVAGGQSAADATGTVASPSDAAAANGTAADPAAFDADSVAATAGPPAGVTEPTLTPEQVRLQPWAREIQSNSRFEFLNRAAQRKIQQVGHLPPREAFRQVLRDYVEFAPHMVFLLLPVFALLLKLLYVRCDRYYAEHFVFALHTHAFTFVTFTLMLLVPWDVVDTILFFWMVVYVWIAMRTVYRQGVVLTTFKWWVLGWSYLWVFAFGMIGLGIVMLLVT